MRSRWLVAAAVLGGVVLTAVAGFFSLIVAGIITFDTLGPTLLIAFVIFTVLTVPVGLLVAWKGTTPRQRGVAAGMLISWAALGLWVWMGER